MTFEHLFDYDMLDSWCALLVVVVWGFFGVKILSYIKD
jgi:hypothetical protein